MVHIKIYTDASVHKYKDGTKDWGLAAVAYVDSPSHMLEGSRYMQGGVQIGRIIDTTQCSNPTAELLAAALAMEQLHDVLVDSPHRHDVTVTVYSDYNGVANYANGIWKVRKINTGLRTAEFRKMGLRLNNAVELLKNTVRMLTVEHIKGHSGHRGNEVADNLANLAACGPVLTTDKPRVGPSNVNVNEFPKIIEQLDKIKKDECPLYK
jgi:ribonuclease HI